MCQLFEMVPNFPLIHKLFKEIQSMKNESKYCIIERLVTHMHQIINEDIMIKYKNIDFK